MIRSVFYCALALAALLYLTAHVGQAMPATAPADLCPPPAHTTSSAACLPCTPTECRPADPSPGWRYNAPSICDYADFTRPCIAGPR